MRRWIYVFLICSLLQFFTFAQSEQEKKERFLKAREEMKTVPADESSSSTPKPKPKPKSVKKSSPSPTATPKAVPEPSTTPKSKAAAEETPPTKKKKKALASTPTPTPRKKKPGAASPTPQAMPSPALDEEAAKPRPTPTPTTEPTAKPTPAPSPTPSPTPAPTPPPTESAAASPPVVIQKSGYEGDAGLEPPPPPPRRSWFFGRAKEENFRYITASVRNEIRIARVQKRRWRYIVVHNSGTKQGNAKVFDYYHRRTRKMQNGLAYHFVIGNGTSSGDGEIEVGSRWRRQINGGHVHSDYLNNIALGICFVGDFNRSTPTKRQLEALDELIRHLRTRVGKIDRKDAIVKAHREINPPRWPTDCPGDKFPYDWLHSRFRD